MIGPQTLEAPAESGHRPGDRAQGRFVRLLLDSGYVGLFLAVIASILLLSLTDAGWLAAGVTLLVQIAVCTLAIRLGKPPRSRIMHVLCLSPLLVIPLAYLVDASINTGMLLLAGSLAIGYLVAILITIRRLVRSRMVDVSVMFGTLSVYLLLGLLYSAAYVITNVVQEQKAFVSLEKSKFSDYVYFSYTTLTTTGYGDITASDDFARLLAVSEMLVGQIFLVTIISFVVGKLGGIHFDHKGEA